MTSMRKYTLEGGCDWDISSGNQTIRNRIQKLLRGVRPDSPAGSGHRARDRACPAGRGTASRLPTICNTRLWRRTP